MRLQQLGHMPLWIGNHVRARDIPGEHLAPAAKPLLAQLDALDLLDRNCHLAANVVFSAWGYPQLAERNSMVNLEGAGSVLDRGQFESDLRVLALQRGLKPLAFNITNARYNRGQWQITFDGMSEEIDYVIDATGRRALIAGKFSTRYNADRLTAAVGYYRQIAGWDLAATRATLIEATVSGWWYAALLPDRRLVLNYYSDTDLLPKRLRTDLSVWADMIGASHNIRRWISEAGFVIDRPPRIYNATSTWHMPCAGHGWIGIGDAAAAFDPLSSHGMTTALWTAILGAEAAVAFLKGDREPSNRYIDKVALGIQNFLESRSGIYGLERRFAKYPFWQRRQLSLSPDESKAPYSEP